MRPQPLQTNERRVDETRRSKKRNRRGCVGPRLGYDYKADIKVLYGGVARSHRHTAAGNLPNGSIWTTKPTIDYEKAATL